MALRVEISAETKSDLVSFNSAIDGQGYMVYGDMVRGDSNARTYYYSSTSTATADGELVLAATGMGGTGRFIKDTLFNIGAGLSYNLSTDVLTNTITNTNQLTNGAGFITGINSSNVTTALGYTPPNANGTSSQYMCGDGSKVAIPAIPSVARTTSTLSLSLVGTGATGTQISNTKDSTVRLSCTTSTTSTIGGPSTSVVLLKICSTNNATEGSWTTIATLESDQTITLAVALQSVQIVKGQLCADVPAGFFVKLVNSGTGTHSEQFISGQQTIYG